MDKSPDAFRTISEVADWLGTPTHVLRFWESRFTQVKPVKRAGGRRYYRPADMALLGGIKKLLHDDGLTIRGVQKILREQGVKHVAALSKPIDGGADLEIEVGIAQDGAPAAGDVVDAELERREPPQIIRQSHTETPAPEPAAPAPVASAPMAQPEEPVAPAPVDESYNPFAQSTDEAATEDAPQPETADDTPAPEIAASPDGAEPAFAEPAPEVTDPAPVPDAAASAEPEADTQDAAPQTMVEQPYDYSHGEMHPGETPTGVPEISADDGVADIETPEPAAEPAAEPLPEQAEDPAPAPRSLPEMTPMPEGPTLSEDVLARLRRSPVVDRHAVRPVYERLAELRGRMTAGQAGGHSG
ncbi:MerR family transcriptional regulator [Psychromarinibacter sp. S121]|uniref:MerR family transcriptional regulator n=1 Tax=Psychromarinibacter sp. S121 TaxID=3415127 RepID=UPI003C7B9E15